MIGVGILIITALSWGLYFMINSPSNSTTGTTFTTTVGPIFIQAGQRNISNFVGMQRPNELEQGIQCGLTYFKFEIVDALGNTIPMETVYVEQVSLFELVDVTTNSIRVLSSAGNEASNPAINLGVQYAVLANIDTDWGVKWNLFNVLGAASNAPISIFIKVTVYYTPISNQVTFTYVEWDMLGLNSETVTSGESTFNVPGTGGFISKTVSGLFIDETTVIFVWGKRKTPKVFLCSQNFIFLIFSYQGNLHIGAVNISLYHGSTSQIATSAVTYAASGYINNVAKVEIYNTFLAQDAWITTTYYDNSRAYANATALMLVYRTVPVSIGGRSQSKNTLYHYNDRFFNYEKFAN